MYNLLYRVLCGGDKHIKDIASCNTYTGGSTMLCIAKSNSVDDLSIECLSLECYALAIGCYKHHACLLACDVTDDVDKA